LFVYVCDVLRLRLIDGRSGLTKLGHGMGIQPDVYGLGKAEQGRQNKVGRQDFNFLKYTCVCLFVMLCAFGRVMSGFGVIFLYALIVCSNNML
jgi:hypothetical protein